MQKCQQILAQVRANRYVSQKREKRDYPLTRLTGRGKRDSPSAPPLSVIMFGLGLRSDHL